MQLLPVPALWNGPQNDDMMSCCDEGTWIQRGGDPGGGHPGPGNSPTVAADQV